MDKGQPSVKMAAWHFIDIPRPEVGSELIRLQAIFTLNVTFYLDAHGRQLDERRNRKQPKLVGRRSRNVERQLLRNPLGRGRKCSGAAVLTNPLKTSACIIVGRGSKNDGAS